jgi:GTPase SAR1 family protein
MMRLSGLMPLVRYARTVVRDGGRRMARILITGMSGTGKSAVIIELMRRGYRAIDLDTSEWSH